MPTNKKLKTYTNNILSKIEKVVYYKNGHYEVYNFSNKPLYTCLTGFKYNFPKEDNIHNIMVEFERRMKLERIKDKSSSDEKYRGELVFSTYGLEAHKRALSSASGWFCDDCGKSVFSCSCN